MAEIVNLRGARKRRAREKEEAAAAANRVSFGAPKAEKQAARAERERLARRLDALRLDDGDEKR
jgi:hypothetical protein